MKLCSENLNVLESHSRSCHLLLCPEFLGRSLKTNDPRPGVPQTSFILGSSANVCQGHQMFPDCTKKHVPLLWVCLYQFEHFPKWESCWAVGLLTEWLIALWNLHSHKTNRRFSNPHPFRLYPPRLNRIFYVPWTVLFRIPVTGMIQESWVSLISHRNLGLNESFPLENDLWGLLLSLINS